MIVNKKSKKNRVEFVSYDGKYPNLCSGVLTVRIDGETVKFGHHYTGYHFDENGKGYFEDERTGVPFYQSFWRSGGEVRYSNGDYETIQREWEIDVDSIPEKFWDVADELDEIINENIPWGCCGGCI